MARTQINGLSFNVESTGIGPAVFAFHGFTGNTRTWDKFVSDAQGKYTVVTMDMLGHGQSDSPLPSERYDISNCIKDVDSILSKLRIESVNWLGYSMGGRVALAVALALPQKTVSLILESASPGLAETNERKARIQQDSNLADWINKVGVSEFVTYWENLPLFSSQNNLPILQLETHRSERLKNNSIGLANSLKGIGTGIQPPLHDKLVTIPFPILLISGELDTKFTEIAKEMNGIIPESQLRAINNAGHSTHFEKPTEFNQIVLTFLDSVNKIDSQMPKSSIKPIISNLWSH